VIGIKSYSYTCNICSNHLVDFEAELNLIKVP